jgi:hypothetical protein
LAQHSLKFSARQILPTVSGRSGRCITSLPLYCVAKPVQTLLLTLV